MAPVLLSPALLKSRKARKSSQTRMVTSLAKLYIPEVPTCVVPQSNTVYVAPPPLLEPMDVFEERKAEAAKKKKKVTGRRTIEMALKKMGRKKNVRGVTAHATVPLK